MESFAPGLQAAVQHVSADLRAIVFFVCLTGFMLQIAKARPETDSLTEPFVRALVVVALVATLPYWFDYLERLFLVVANTIRDGYTEHPMQAATLLRDSVKDSESAFSFSRVGEALYKAILWAGAKLVVLIGSVVQVPLLLMQHVLKLLCYLFLPLALACGMVPSLTSLTTRYVQQTLAVLAWPVGFAVTELVAFHLITSYQTNLMTAVGVRAGEIDPSSVASVLGGLVGALWLLVGTLGTPVLMQMLFCSGAPISGGGQSALQQLYTMQQVAWMAKSVKLGGASTVATVAASAGRTPPPAEAPPRLTGDQPSAPPQTAPEIPKPQTTI